MVGEGGRYTCLIKNDEVFLRSIGKSPEMDTDTAEVGSPYRSDRIGESSDLGVIRESMGVDRLRCIVVL